MNDTFVRAADPPATTFAGGEVLALSGIFSVTFDSGTLQVFVSKVQGVREEGEDYPVELQGYTGSQIDFLTTVLPHQGTFDLYASALNGATRGSAVCSYRSLSKSRRITPYPEVTSPTSSPAAILRVWVAPGAAFAQ